MGPRGAMALQAMIPPRQQTRQGGLGLVRDIVHHLRARGCN
jgi:hypothetical protein